MIDLRHGDMRDVLPTIEAESVHSVVTDPPYELAFMGRHWDQTGVAFQPDTWRAVLRVLKPGGYLLAMGGTRTFHRLACAIEDAGFEVRDTIAWVYGSGFPKSLDIGKAIDRQRDDRADILRVTTFLADAADRCGVSRAEVDAHMGTSDMGGWWLSRLKHRCQCPGWDQWVALKEMLRTTDEMDEEVWRLNGRKGKPGDDWAEREVLGYEKNWGSRPAIGPNGHVGEWSITAPATDAARQWNGWGTALKPSMELVVVARRPLSERTVAANVLKHSTGGINIDKCRVTAQRPSDTLSAWEQDQYLCASCAEHAEQIKRPGSPETRASSATRRAEPTLSESQRKPSRDTLQNTATGWSDGMLGADISTSSSTDTSGKKLTDQSQMDLSSTTSTRTNSTTGLRTCNSCGAAITYATTTECISPATKTSPLDVSQPKSAETGSVLIPHGARKSGLGASPRTDAPGQPSARWPSNLAHDGSPEVEAAFAAFGTSTSTGGQASLGAFRNGKIFGAGKDVTEKRDPGLGDTGTASRFFFSAKADREDRADSKHPTVKPIDLIRWLTRLVTPPGGTVLDPFAGSGTTGEAAMLEGFDAILIEREAEHAADIQHRQRRWHGGDLPLFAEAAD